MNTTRTGRFLTSALLSYVFQAVALCSGLFLAPFLLHRLGQHDFGIWLVGFQFLSYFMLLDLGVVALLPREVAYITGKPGGVESNGPELALLVGQTARVVLYQTPVVLLACAAAWFMKPAAWHNYFGVIGMVLFVFACAFPLRIFDAILQGLQDVTFCGGLNLASWAVGTAVTVLCVYRNLGLYALAISWTTTQAFTILACAYRVRSRFPQVLPGRLPPMPFSTARRFLGRGVWVSLNQVAQPLLSGSDLVVVGKLVGPAAVVPYNSTGKLFAVLSNQPQMLMQTAVPGLTELRRSGSKEHVFNVTMSLTLSVLLLCGGIATVVMAVNQGFVTRWLGKEQYAGMQMTVLMSVGMLLRQWNLTAAYATYCFGHERRIVITVFFDGLLTTCSAIGFVWLLGPSGGPLGAIVGVSCIGLPSNLRALARETGLSTFDLIRPLGNWLWRFLALFAFAGVTAYLWPMDTIVEIGVRGALLGLLYCAVMWPVAMRSPLGVYLQRIRMAVQTRVVAFARLAI